MSNLTLSEQVAYYQEQENIRYDMYEQISRFVAIEDAVKITTLLMQKYHIEVKHASE